LAHPVDPVLVLWKSVN